MIQNMPPTYFTEYKQFTDRISPKILTYMHGKKSFNSKRLDIFENYLIHILSIFNLDILCHVDHDLT